MHGNQLELVSQSTVGNSHRLAERGDELMQVVCIELQPVSRIASFQALFNSFNTETTL